ncbi:monocarboxylate transporter 12-like [Glandiceps talaboti]
MADGKHNSPRNPPDGGWGWVIVLATFISCALTAGVLYSFSVLYVAFLDAFGESKSKTAWIGSVFHFVFLLTNPFAISLTRKIGHRKTVMLAGVVSFIGLITSSFATNLVMLNFTFGTITAIGCGLSFMPCIDMVSMYFKKRLSIALGLALAGTGGGQFALSLICQYLVDTYGWRGMLLIYSGIALNLSVAGSLMWPLKARENGKDETTNPSKTSDPDINTEEKNREKAKLSLKETESPNSVKTTNDECVQEYKTDGDETKDKYVNYPKCNTCYKSCLSVVFDFSLFREPVYWFQFLIVIGQGFLHGTVLVHMVRRARDYGISNTFSSLIPAAMGLPQMLTRPLWGAIGHIHGLRANIPYGIAMLMCGVSSIISIYTTTFTGQVIYIAIFGIFVGGFTVYIPLTVSSFLGPEKIGYGASLLFTIQGLTVLFVSPIAGLIRDETGVYVGAFWMAGIAGLLSGVVAFLLPVVEKVVMRRRQRFEATLAEEDIVPRRDATSEDEFDTGVHMNPIEIEDTTL